MAYALTYLSHSDPFSYSDSIMQPPVVSTRIVWHDILVEKPRQPCLIPEPGSMKAPTLLEYWQDTLHTTFMTTNSNGCHGQAPGLKVCPASQVWTDHTQLKMRRLSCICNDVRPIHQTRTFMSTASPRQPGKSSSRVIVNGFSTLVCIYVSTESSRTSGHGFCSDSHWLPFASVAQQPGQFWRYHPYRGSCCLISTAEIQSPTLPGF